MRPPQVEAFVSVVLAFGVSLPTAYVLRYPGCAPSSFTCLMGGVCPLLCGNAAAEFPEVLLVGLLFGTIPGMLGYVFVGRERRTRGPGSPRRLRPVRIPAPGLYALIGVGISLLAFPWGGLTLIDILAALAMPLALAFGAVAMGWEWALGLLRSRARGGNG